MSVSPKYFTLSEMLQQRLFRIPDFQRAYSWESKQRKELFGDLQKVSEAEKSRHHFMSTIVCLQSGEVEGIGSDEFKVFEIVDGQQRLTTLIILLRAIAKQLDPENRQERKEKEKLDELLVKDDRRLILLQTNHDSKMLFRNYLETGDYSHENSVETLAEKNLVKAFKECEKFTNDWNNGPLDLLGIVKNRLDFIFYVLKDRSSVYTIFEVLNSRGLAVDWLDKCKSMLMGVAYENLPVEAQAEQIQEIHSLWARIYRIIGLKTVPGDEILRFAATLRHPNLQSKILTSEKSMQFFREYCEQDPKRVLETTNYFVNIATKLKEIHTNKRIAAVTRIAHTRLLALSIMNCNSIYEEEVEKVLSVWEKVTFRIFGMCGRDSRTKVGDYTRLAYNITSGMLTYKDITDDIELIGREYPISRAIRELKDTDCYNGWEDYLRYFMFRYEEYLAKQAGSEISMEIWSQIWDELPSLSIEHIHPQTITDEWKGKFGTKKEFLERQVNRLGNLILLPPKVNTRASNRPFPIKKEIYQKYGMLRHIHELLELEEWNKEEMEKREDTLLSWAESEWR